MRLRHVSVKGLFGIFDHEIPLNLEERITIIHGLNGYGKTIILQMIYEALTGEIGTLATVPFKSFELTFDDDACLRIESCGTALPDDTDQWMLRVMFEQQGHKPESIRLGREVPPMSLGWRPNAEEEVRTASEHSFRAWLKELGLQVPVFLVQTQRLLSPGRDKTMEPTVDTESEALCIGIQLYIERYAALAQELDRTFPSRLLEQASPPSLSFEDFQRQLVGLEEQRSQLTALGLLDAEQDPGPIPRTEDPTKLGVLAIYLQDMKAKLAVFDALAERIAVLMSIINGRFRYKKLSVDRKEGLIFTTSNGRRLPASALSSGEQHELVLLLQLLFNFNRDSLILIDEPEISLHLTWQQEFLPDLMRVVALSGCDVVIATHSPDIIGEHWNLTVQLQGPPT